MDDDYKVEKMTPYQKGWSAQARTYLPKRSQDRKILSQAVHSGDRKPHKDNPFIDTSNSYDAKGQAILRDIATRNAKRLQKAKNSELQDNR